MVLATKSCLETNFLASQLDGYLREHGQVNQETDQIVTIMWHISVAEPRRGRNNFGCDVISLSILMSERTILSEGVNIY